MSIKLPSINKTSRSNSMSENKPAIRKLKESLHIETTSKAKISQNKQILSSIMQDADIIVTNKQLQESIMKLSDLGLLSDYRARIAKQLGFKKREYVMNDYHNKSTTNGYSRNYGGLFYNR